MHVLSTRTAVAIMTAVLLGLSSCSTGEEKAEPVNVPTAPASLSLSSAAFAEGGSIPSRYTCDGVGVSPPLTWSESKPAEEFVLTVTDPDAPGGTFVHWVMYSIASNAESIGEGQGPAGAKQGANDAGTTGYTGPCPPAGDQPHRYVFTMYALSSARTGGVTAGATADTLLKAISCCIQEQGSLTGTYGR
jgi:Raf kinase inhibitor-like YbhB/YbcL family protein